MGDEAVRYAVTEAVATLTMDQPHNRNALTPALMAGLAEGLESALADEAVGVVVLTNSGPAFCAGADLSGVHSAMTNGKWGVTIAGSQKGLMLPPGISFNAISAKALTANTSARLPRSYWDWQEMLKTNRSGFFPTRPRPTSSTACGKPFKYCTRRGFRMSSVAMIVTRKQLAPQYGPGALRSFARSRVNTPVR